MAISSQSKAKRLMRNFTGAGASVAVVTAVASMTVSVQAKFLDVTVFENKAYYQVEVVETITIEGSGSLAEDAEVPTQQSVRMRVQNQWDDFVISLLYGFNEGVIEPLRANQSYTLTVEMEGSIGWRTLDTYTFNTRPRTNSVVSQLVENTTPLSEKTSFTSSIFTQDGTVEATNWYAELAYGNIRQKQSLIIGDNDINWLNLPHQNADANLQVFATLDGVEKLITTRTFQTIPFVDANMILSFPTYTSLRVETTEDPYYQDATYAIEVTSIQSSGSVNQTLENAKEIYPLTTSPLLIENLMQGETYTLSWMMTYQDDLGKTNTLTLIRKNIVPILTPIFVLGIYGSENSTRFDLTIDNRLTINSMKLTLTSDGQSQVLTFDELLSSDNAYHFTVTLDSQLTLGSTLELLMVQAAPYDYPITIRSIVYQGGETI